MDRRVRRGGICAAVLGGLAVLAGSTPVWAHDSGFGLTRYLPDGSLDATFGHRGIVVNRSAQRSLVANALALQPDGKILIGGLASDAVTGTLRLAVARYNSDGTTDASFGDSGIATTSVGSAGGQVTAMTLQQDGGIVVAGTAYAHASADDEFLVARYTSAGAIDPTFGGGGVVTTHVGVSASAAQAVVVQPDAKIVVAGTAFSNGPTDDDFAIVRYAATGDLDAEFGSVGVVTTDLGFAQTAAGPSLDRGEALALQPDGRILVAGSIHGDGEGFAVVRYDTRGGLDSGFGRGGAAQVYASAPQVHALLVAPSGAVVLAGSSAAGSRTTAPFTLVRFQSDGQPDPTFGANAIVNTTFEGSRSGARAVAVESDGKLLTAGARYGAPSAQGDAQPQSGFALTRYDPTGHPDPGFGAGGRVLTDLGDAGATPVSLLIQPDGKILAAGLVFFQVPTTASPRDERTETLRLAGPAAAAVLIAVAGLLLRRHSVSRTGRRSRGPA